MVKVVIKKLDAKRAGSIGAKGAAVTFKRVDRQGKAINVRMIDSASETFGKDFTWVFGANVRKARDENKRLTGARDRDPVNG